MVEINIAKDFARTPGFRVYADGPKSGQEFFETLLRPKYQEALTDGSKLKIILDGTTGYTSSFLNEAFRLLGHEFGAENVWNNIIIISNEIPKYIQKVKESVYEMER
ncbi:STAS-like domain-containing protein [Alistipes finegoldii]|uniref:STAS-like domain-containing protein n=1 Tax=Alistipes finegoldii TaxID=214856 RepID=UPI002671740F|nr:DUF4325 domain-containing protein [Alistipes finegoldii]